MSNKNVNLLPIHKFTKIIIHGKSDTNRLRGLNISIRDVKTLRENEKTERLGATTYFDTN